MSEKSWAGLQKTPGWIYLNRRHERSYSVQVFRINADQLIMFLESNIDTKNAMNEISDLHSSHYTMGEAIRRLHNFLAGAMTLVDHTRAFIRRHYDGTKLQQQFSNGTNANFANNYTTRFVQDLRNFMVHRGMLPLTRTTRFTPVPDGGSNQLQSSTGWYLEKKLLLEFDKWNKEAKAYLRNAPDEIDLLKLVHEYMPMVISFHEELEQVLDKHHELDMMDSTVYEAELRSRVNPGDNTAGLQIRLTPWQTPQD